MSTLSKIASQQMKTIEATGDKQTEDVNKFRNKKTRDKKCWKKRDGSKSSNKEKKNKKNSESPPKPTCQYCGHKQRHARKTEHPMFKQTCNKFQKRAISRLCAAHREKCSNLKTKKALMKSACKWRLSLWYRIMHSSGLQMFIHVQKTSQQP